jgi:hypothetical protein
LAPLDKSNFRGHTLRRSRPSAIADAADLGGEEVPYTIRMA